MEESGIGAAVQQLVELTRQTNKTTILESAHEPKGYYYLVGPDGASTKQVAAPAWHRETLDTPDELRGFIEKHGVGDNQAVFIAADQIVYVYNLEDRRNVSVCPLKISPQYAWLAAPQQQMIQADLVRLLRITFKGCLTSENLLPLIRELKFDSENNAAGSVQHGRESVGKQIMAAVTGADKLPEEIGMIVPVFENHPFKAKIGCALEVFPQERTFRISPFPLETKLAMDGAMRDIEDVFDLKNVAVHRGKP